VGKLRERLGTPLAAERPLTGVCSQVYLNSQSAAAGKYQNNQNRIFNVVKITHFITAV